MSEINTLADWRGPAPAAPDGHVNGRTERLDELRLTLVLSPILVLSYRRRVTSWMGKLADGADHVLTRPQAVDTEQTGTLAPSTAMWREIILDDLARRVAELNTTPGPAGLYSVHDLLCFMDTWEEAMHALVGRASVVLMDLRGFTDEREGCRTELQYLASTAVDRPVVLLVDDSTELATASEIGGAEPAAAPAGDAAWVVARITGNENAAEQNLFIALTQRLSGEISTPTFSPASG